VSAVFYPLGYPVAVDTSHAAVMDAAAESWSMWPRLFDARELCLDVTVGAGRDCSAAPRFESSPGGFALVSDEDNRAHFGYGSQTAFMRVADSTSRRRAWFRYHFLEALTLTALDSVAFTPLHAACVARNGKGVLLCGDSGAGKTSLAYACAKAGWTFVSDDAVHFVSGGDGTVVGNPWRAHLRPSSVALFPELADAPKVEQMNSKEALGVSMTGAMTAVVSECIFLARRPGPAILGDFDRREAMTYFLRYLVRSDTARQRADIDVVLAHPPRSLEYERIEDAVALLDQVAS
jgi:hypothetical protein